MDSKLTSILEDLYKLDPSLREREAELLPILEALLRAKPEAALDARFAAQLREKLLTHPQTSLRHSSVFMPNALFNKFAFAGLGGMIALVVAIPVTYELSKSGTTFENFALGDLSSVPTIKSVGDDAFGTLTASNVQLGNQEARSSVAYGMGGSGGGGNVAAQPATDAAKVASETSVLVGEPYPVITYKYTYNGETIDLSSVSDAVYRKDGGLNIGNLGNDLLRAKLGPVDLSAFSGLNLQSFSVTQSDKNGYSIYVDPTYGTISINGNEGIWGYSGEYVPFREDQVMSHEALIAVADAFLSNYAIDKTGFGSPVVDERGLTYARTQPAEFRYIPEVMTVTYPLMLDGQVIYNGDGSAYGLQVAVNMRTQKVSNANLNVASSYDKSSYELERDSAKILELAAKGGIYNYPVEGATETVDIQLGTPSVILINHYNYNNGLNETLFIPALNFPITQNSDTYPVYSDSIVIPLVKSVIDQAANEPVYHILEDSVKAAE